MSSRTDSVVAPVVATCAGRAGRMLRVVTGAAELPRVPFFVDEGADGGPTFARDDALVSWSGDRFRLERGWGAPDVVGVAAHVPFRLDVEVGSGEVLGFGAATGAPTRNGARFRLMTLDTLFYGIAGASYTAFPFFIVREGARVWAMLIATTFPLDVRVDSGRVSLRAACDTEGTPVDLVVFGGGIADILADLGSLVGRTYLPPAWALGFHQSRWSYKTADAVIDVARRLRAEDLPADAVHLDIHTMDDYRVFTFSPERFPDPKGLHDTLRDLGLRTMAIVDPGVSVARYPVYEEGEQQDLWLKRRDGTPYEGKVWPGATVFPDFNEARVREAWGAFHKPLIDAGVAGVWNDMNDPVFQVGRVYDPLVEDVRHHAGSHQRNRNLYANQMAMATHAGFRRFRPGVRPFVLTRSGFLGIQRHAAVWTGDNVSSWEHLEENLHMVVNLGLSGVPIAGADVGGFGGRRGTLGIAKLRPPAELFVRWMELGSFMPFCRVHSVLYAPGQEPWRFGKRALALCRQILRRRYRLLPLLYRLVLEAHETGMPLVRPLWMHDAVPAGAPERLARRQFLLGPDVLVAPVLERGIDARDVFLPPGSWTCFTTGDVLAGGRVVRRAAPLGTTPTFVRAGAALWGCGVGRNVEASLQKALTLEVSAPVAGAVGRGSLFLDDGEGTDAPRFLLDARVEDLGGRLRVSLASTGEAPAGFPSVVELRAPRAFGAAVVDGRRVTLTPRALTDEDRRLAVGAAPVPLLAREIVIE